MSSNFNFSNLNDEAKVNRSHIARSGNDPNMSTLSNALNKSELNPQIKKKEIIFPSQFSNGFKPEEKKTINGKDFDVLSKISILQSKNTVHQASDFPQINQNLRNVSQIPNQLGNLGLPINEKDFINNQLNPSINKIAFPVEKENDEIRSTYSLYSKDLDNSRINQNNITNSIHDGANGIGFLDNLSVAPQVSRSPIRSHFDIPSHLHNKENSGIFNLSNNLIDQNKINPTINKSDLFDRKISNIPFAQNGNNANPLNSNINTEQEINENDIIMLEENINDKVTGNSLMEEVRVGAYGGKINQPNHQSKINDTESFYEDAKSELNIQPNPLGVYGNVVIRNNTSFNNENNYSNLSNEESKRNLSTDKKPENNFNFTLKNKNPNQNLNEGINLAMSGNPYRRVSAPNNLLVDKPEQQNKSINDLRNLDKSRASQNPLTPNLKFKEDILGKSALDLELNQNQSEFIFNDKKHFEEEILKNPEMRNNSFFSPNPNQIKNFQTIFDNVNTNNEFKNFNLNEENHKSRTTSISNIDKNNFNNIQIIQFANEDINSNNFYAPNANNHNMNEQFFSDPDEENIKNHNFKLLLETEHSKSKLETRVRNDTNVNNFLDIRPDNSQLNFSGISNNIIDNQRKDTETNYNLKVPKPNKPSNSLVNNTINYGNKIKTIFDEPNEENPNLSQNNLRKISIPNILNKTTNINPNNMNKIINDKRNSSMNNPNNININSANVVNYYNFNFNNNFKVNHDSQIKDFDMTLENKNVNPITLHDTNTILRTDIMETDKLIPEEEKQNLSLIYDEYDPELLVSAKNPTIHIPTIKIEDNIELLKQLPKDLVESMNGPKEEIPTINIEDNIKSFELQPKDTVENLIEPKDEIHFIIRHYEEKLDETIIENSIIDISKPEFKQIKNSRPIKPNSESLFNYYSQDFLKDWNETAVIKIANNKKGVREDNYFIQGFLNEFNLIDAINIIGRNYIQSLDRMDQEVRPANEKPESSNVLDLKDLFSFKDVDKDSKKGLDQMKKKEILEFLQKKSTKTTFNKISYLYDNEILKQKYNISNEKIFFEAQDETVVFTSCINRNMDRDLISQLNNLNDLNNELSNKKNLSIINEVDSINETKRFKTTLNKEINNNDGRIHLWRESICDGNSFYRMFMFGYLEHLIFEKNISLLAKLFKRILFDYANRFEINEVLDKNYQLDMSKILQNINIERVLIIFNIIINQMRLGDYTAAYKSLLNAFNDNDGCFDRLMIEYLRLNLYHQIILIEKKDLDEKIKRENTFINYDLTNIKNNAYLFVEAGKIHLDAVTKIYEVDLELYYFEGALNSYETKFISSKKMFHYNQEKESPMISMFYNLNHFSIFYNTETFNQHRQILRSPVTHLNDIVFYEENFKCDQCPEVKDNKKVFFKKQNVSSCLECIRKKTDIILDNRAMGLIGDNYMSREFVCRPLTVDEILLLNDYLYIQLFSKNIWSSILKKIRSICDKCSKKSDNFINNNNFYNYCGSCLKTLIDLNINQLVIREEYGKTKIIEDDYITDVFDLKAKFDFDQAIGGDPEKLGSLKNHEKNRLKQLYDSTCLICTKNKKRSVSKLDQDPIIQFYNININKDPKAVDNFYKHHIICSSCCDYMSKQFKTELGEKTISQILDGTNKSLKFNLDCKLCGVKHSIVIISNNPISNNPISNNPISNNPIPNKNNDKACCGGCNIF